MNTNRAAGLREMVQQARDLARAGRAVESSQMWQRVLGADPDHTEALLALSTQALAQKEPARALQLLQHAARTATRDPMVRLYMALAHRELGNPDAELAALAEALAIDPYFYPALLHKGTLLERQGKRRQAARVFRDVLRIMPSPEKLGGGLQKAAVHARSAVQENMDSLERHLDAVLAELRHRYSGARLDRFERSVQVMIGRQKMFTPEPIMLHYADLAPIQFYDDALFPWMPGIEAATDTIRDELKGVLADSRGEFRPYVQHPPDAPVNQWQELNHSLRWSTYFLWSNGEKVAEHCERCPKTTAALEAIPMTRIANFSPTAMFSCLDPRTAIPPHTGETNTRLIAHLPLIVPPACSFRVGHQTRAWEYGKAFVFDDSIEHEARNDGDELRVVLIFDVWNPFLAPAERELVSALVNGVRDYYRADG